MILRLTSVAALHGAAGVAFGVTSVLAACTLAQVAKKGVDHRATLQNRVGGLPSSPLAPTGATRPGKPS